MFSLELFIVFGAGLFLTVILILAFDQSTPSTKRMAPIRVRTDERRRRYSPPPQDEPQSAGEMNLFFLLLVVLVSILVAGRVF
jgi:hypothetical protein